MGLGLKVLTSKKPYNHSYVYPIIDPVNKCKLCLTLHEQIDISKTTYITVKTSLGNSNRFDIAPEGEGLQVERFCLMDKIC